MQIDRCQTAIIIGGIIIDAAVCIAAGGIDRALVLPVCHLAAAALLLHGAEDVEKLADAPLLRVVGDGVQLRKRGADEARHGRQIARQAQRAHAPAVWAQRERLGKAVFRLSGRKVHIVVQIEQLLAERRVIGQNADRVFIDVQAVCGRFDRDRFSFVGNQPMQLRGGQSGAERRSGQVEPGKLCPGLLNRRAPAQQPRDELKLRDIRPVRLWLRVYGVSDEIQPRHAQAGFVDGVVIKRIPIRHMGHADYGVVRMQRACMVEVERVISRRDCHLFAVAAFVIQRPAKIQLSGLVCDRGTHLALHSFQACVALVCAVFTG